MFVQIKVESDCC
jgi:Niemann-Pick C1 protein